MLTVMFKMTLWIAMAIAVASPAFAQSKDPKTRIAERDFKEMKRMLPGVYTNEEQVYFQDILNLPEADHVDRVELVIKRTGDSFTATTTFSDGRTIEARHDYGIVNGKIQADSIRFGRVDCTRIFEREFSNFRAEGCQGSTVVAPEGIILVNPNGTHHLNRARTFNCWASPRKTDGSYAFYSDIVLHDQGGRAWIEATTEHPRIGLKLRNVRWPSGVNRDSLVLYTYEGDDDDFAPGYAWADPDADRIAINTRRVQASCTAGDENYIPNLNLRTGSGN